MTSSLKLFIEKSQPQEKITSIMKYYFLFDFKQDSRLIEDWLIS
jgi:hypothetical protein